MANSVNAAVVESILILMIVNVAISQLYNMLSPREQGFDVTASRPTLAPLSGRRGPVHPGGTKPVRRLGHILVFFVRALVAVPIVLRQYRANSSDCCPTSHGVTARLWSVVEPPVWQWFSA